ncbi:hypothetical protein SSBR45G_56200 [Bradyrhizobium sp. SSBR45G]|nr:hypothetical protein SSBR45G_56200 [Bradyrhizobium sp. SSBR45G]GLH88100.1 hypothetical protein SSBR45R_55610 [Bradyrhizobium sp. SSBR45R]
MHAKAAASPTSIASCFALQAACDLIGRNATVETGMGGKTDTTTVEATGSTGPDQSATAPRHKRKHRGVPPPARFDIDALPGSSNLTALEAAAVIRRTPGALEQWRRNPDHPLKWRYVDGRPLYRVDAVREYLSRSSAAKRPQPQNVHEDGRAAQS